MARAKSAPPFSTELERQRTELDALLRTLEVSRGVCSFSIAVCNSPALRDHLIHALQLAHPAIVAVAVPSNTTDVFAAARAAAPLSPETALCVTNIDASLSSDASEYPILRALNASRELWQAAYRCPVIFWLPEYAATLLSIHARDFWSWLSHHFEFVSEFSGAAMGLRDTSSGDIFAASNLDSLQKRFRIAELEQRLQEAGVPPKAQLVEPVLLWLNELGFLHAVLGEVRRAIDCHEQALVIAREIGDRRGEGRALGNLGNAYSNLGEVRRAIEYYQQRLAIAREIGDRRGEGNALDSLGNAYADLGEVRRAIEYYEQDLAIAREIGDRRGEGNALGNLGIAYRDLGEVRRAIGYHEQALVIDREIGHRRGEGNALGNLGNAYADLGEVPRAIEYYEQRLAIAREIGDRRGEGNALGNLGNAYADLGEVPRAIEYYEQALVIDREIGHRRGEGTAFWNMSLALHGLGQRDEAVAHAAAALAIYEQIEDPHAEKVRKELAAWREEAGGSGPGA